MQIIEIMERTFEAESGDIALYLAMSKKASDEGDPDTAQYLYNVAMDEARHAADFAILLGKVKDTGKGLNQISTILLWEKIHGTRESDQKHRR